MSVGQGIGAALSGFIQGYAKQKTKMADEERKNAQQLELQRQKLQQEFDLKRQERQQNLQDTARMLQSWVGGGAPQQAPGATATASPQPEQPSPTFALPPPTPQTGDTGARMAPPEALSEENLPAGAPFGTPGEPVSRAVPTQVRPDAQPLAQAQPTQPALAFAPSTRPSAASPYKRPSITVSPTTGEAGLTFAPKTAEDLKAESLVRMDELFNQSLMEGRLKVDDVWKQLSREGLPVDPAVREARSRQHFADVKTFFETPDPNRGGISPIDAVYLANGKDPKTIPQHFKSLYAAELTARMLGSSYMSKEDKDAIAKIFEIPTEMKLRFYSQGVGAYDYPTPEQAQRLFRGQDVDIPAEREAAKVKAEKQAAFESPMSLEQAGSVSMLPGSTGAEARAAGRIPLAPAQQNALTQLSSARVILEKQLKPLIDKLFKAQGLGDRLKNRGTTAVETILQNDPDYVEYQRITDRFLSTFARGIGGVRGTDTEGDVNRARGFFPRLTPIPDSAKFAQQNYKHLIEFLDDYTATIRSGGYGTGAGAGGAGAAQPSPSSQPSSLPPGAEKLTDIGTAMEKSLGSRVTKSQAREFLIKTGRASNEAEADQIIRAMQGTQQGAK